MEDYAGLAGDLDAVWGSPASDDNLEAIARFNEMVGRLVGRRMSDAVGEKT